MFRFDNLDFPSLHIHKQNFKIEKNKQTIFQSISTDFKRFIKESIITSITHTLKLIFEAYVSYMFFLQLKFTNKYYQKHKERLQKGACKRY